MSARRFTRLPVVYAAVLLAGLSGCDASPAKPSMEPQDTVVVEIEGHLIEAEVALDARRAAQGLQHRRSLADGRGMLFVFERPWRIRMWMRNTWIPLSVAFIDQRGIIMEIRTMEPLDERIHRSQQTASYSLEVRAGWFREHRVEVGDRVTFRWRGGRPHWAP